MSFLKINDPLKRDAIVKEYLELKKKIRSNFLSERIGEQQLQTDLSKFYKPITETQKATTREITEGLETIRKEVHDIPGIVSDMEAVKKYGQEKQEEEEEEEEEEEDDEKLVGEIAYYHLNIPDRDKDFGIYKKGDHHYIGKEHVIVNNNDIYLKKIGQKFTGTEGLWELLTSKYPQSFSDKDYDDYEDLMVITDALHRNNDEDNPHPKGNHKSFKWEKVVRPIWYRKKGGVFRNPKKGFEYRGEIKYPTGSGVVVIPSDPNALLERLDLLLASQEAGHTGVRNELVSICDELKRQGVLDTKAYKKLNHLIKK